jgi:hypothetical protein
MPTQKTKSRTTNHRGGSKAITTAVQRVLRSTQRKRTLDGRRPRRRGQRGQVMLAMPATSTTTMFRGFAGLSDIPDFTISYNPADIVLGGATASTAPGSLGLAYWQPRGVVTTSILTAGLLPIAPADSIIGRSYVTDLMKHYTRRVITSVKVYLTSELSNTNQSGLFAIAAVRSGVDAVSCSSTTAASVVTNSDTDVMTMKNPKPFRIYDNCVYDATWAIAGGSGARQNEFGINNADAGTTTVVGTLTDGAGVIPLCLFMGGSGSTAVSVTGQNIVTHRVIVEIKLHLLDYRGSITNFNPLLSKKPMDDEENYCVPPSTPRVTIGTSLRSHSHK